MRWVPVAVAAVLAIWLSRARVPIGLDFEGGAYLRARGTLEAVRARAGDAELAAHGDSVDISIAGGDEADADRVADRLRAAPLELLAVAPTGRTVRAADGTALAVAEPPLLGAADVREVRVEGRAVVVAFADAARLYEVTRERVGEQIAIALGDELLFAARVPEPIAGGALAIHAAEDPDRLAVRMRAGLGGRIEVESVQVIHPTLAVWAGRPVLVALALLAAVLLGLSRVHRAFAIPGVALLAGAAAAAAWLALGGTLSIACHISAALVAAPALLAAALAVRARRATAAWPGAIVFAALAIAGPRIAAGPLEHAIEHGALRAALAHGLPTILAAAVATALALALLFPPRRARSARPL